MEARNEERKLDDGKEKWDIKKEGMIIDVCQKGGEQCSMPFTERCRKMNGKQEGSKTIGKR